MPEQPASKRRKAQKKARINYAIESDVDRTIREQNRFLDHCQLHKTELIVFAITGTKLTGIVHNHDRDTILFGGRGKNAIPRLILKHFIALVIPREGIDLFLQYKGLGTARTKNRKQRFFEAVKNMEGVYVDMPAINLSVEVKSPGLVEKSGKDGK